MKNKYYTPSIEDLFVGYECEMNDALQYKNEWTPVKIGYREDGSYYDHIGDMLPISDCQGVVRTLHLTYEQIEGEGWSRKPMIGLTSIDESIWDVNVPLVKSDLYELRFYEPDRVKILRKTSTIFEGYCSSINEFRKICKLLGI